MDKTDLTKKYSNGEITIVWKPALCIHSGICAKGLPRVFRPKERPWVDAEAADSQKLIDQVSQCPSGALSYFRNDEKTNVNDEHPEIKVKVIPNGPLQVFGQLKVIDSDGKETQKSPLAAFCRCGASKNKPYCDGTHKTIHFQG